MMNGHFNIRVYGILVNDNVEVLISDEREYGMEFTKFPGGGLEYGEGLIDGLAREFQEECQMEIDVLRHIHTADVFMKSAFNDSQVIAVYYLVKNKNPLACRFSKQPFDFRPGRAVDQVFRWIPVGELTESDLTFEMDRIALRALLSEKSHGLYF